MTSSPVLTSAATVGSRVVPSRVVFGPHETNLAQGRSISERHAAYYARRAAGGAGVVVVETASVTANDWPYERAPLAADSPGGWRAVARACRPHDTLVLAGLGHAGSQGSSAWSQEVMWAPSAVADVVSREPPAVLGQDGIDSLVDAFASAASLAAESGLAGVEIDAGAHSLLRQFHSGLTNQRADGYGADRLLFTRRVLKAVRAALGPGPVLALRLSCDELAPWAGVTPDAAASMVAELTDLIDLLTVVRAGPYSTGAYRPDAHTPACFNLELCRSMRTAAAGTPVVLQGSVVDPADAEAALTGGACDLVEMTRALIADATLVSKVRSGRSETVRPCILCNQACRVRDNRNPIVSCVVDPSAGHEIDDPEPATGAPGPGVSSDARRVLVVGAGPAGMESARILAALGWTVRLLECSAAPGGTAARASVGPGRDRIRSFTDWQSAELARRGVELVLGREVDSTFLAAARAEGWEVVLATGGRLPLRYPDAGLPVLDPLDVLSGADLPSGPVAVLDSVGDAVGVNLAEWLAGGARSVTLICPDPVAGTQLSRTGDLADANGRLQRAGVTRRLRSLVRLIAADGVHVEDCWTGEAGVVEAEWVVDCGHRLPEDTLYTLAGDRGLVRAGDCVAPRSILEAVLEGRRAALELHGGTGTGAHRRRAGSHAGSAA